MSMAAMRTVTHRLGVLVLAAALLALTSCDSDDIDGPSGPPSVVLDEEDVEATSIGEVEENITTSSICGLDGSNQWLGADETNAERYERTRDGVTEIVMIGVVQRSESYALAALDELDKRVGSSRCRSGRAGDDDGATHWRTERLSGLGPRTVGFRSMWVTSGDSASAEDEAGQGRHSYLRAYRYHRGQMIFVWLERKGPSDPSAPDLEYLLEKQTRGAS